MAIVILMNKTVKFNFFYELLETYSSEEYDRTVIDSESYLLKQNAQDFGGHYQKQFLNIYHELNVYKKNEMKIAPESKCYTQMYNIY
jgi:hypothetical protein